MSLGGVGEVLLNVTTIVGLALDVPVALLVLYEATKPPRVWALNLFAYVLVGIAAIVAIAIWGALNRAQGYPVPVEVVTVTFRVVLFYLAMFAPLFIWVRRTGRFRDGEL